MKNLLLLSGMDGTGILFRPLLDVLNASYRIAIYDFNDYHHNKHNQDLAYQADKIAKFIHDNFGREPFVVVFESYSSLFVPYLLKYPLAIEKIYIIGGFLTCPSVLAKVGLFINPTWARFLPNKLLGFLLFRHWANEELIGLFREVLAVISSPAILPLFKKRLSNITHAKIPSHLPKSSVPCVYVSARCDDLVNKKAGLVFGTMFENIDFLIIDGTHFLLQTNPKFLAETLNLKTKRI
ncbi:MAG: hypothetical protein Q4B79_07325 [Moraxella sp.]|uniref:alpha/beta fold hydrolase n=1 Tax=Moraxella sp. TaxID=479 RepID=UPI0026DA787D|nr:hypothetical protein [Moraxella sp.]MDO4450749.1 hypothetical protein [Moraxella sp.]